MIQVPDAIAPEKLAPLTTPAAAIVGRAEPVPSCVSVNVAPPIVTIADRDEAVVFAAAANLNAPGPTPSAGSASVSHGADEVALHEQPGCVTTVSKRLPPDAEIIPSATSVAKPHVPGTVPTRSHSIGPPGNTPSPSV